MTRFLISNDDGIDALGINLLAEIASEVGRVQVVAPDREQSATSHALTLLRPLRAIPRGAGRFVVSFTASRALVAKIERTKAVLSHRVPTGELAEVLERALDVAIAVFERQRFGAARRAGPRASDDVAPAAWTSAIGPRYHRSRSIGWLRPRKTQSVSLPGQRILEAVCPGVDRASRRAPNRRNRRAHRRDAR